MASAAPLKDIDEQFLQCCICMEQLKDPKILPCLHRYCRDCLKKIVKKQAKKIECPTCREKHTLPDGGVDGLKTDFNTKNIVEFIQLQDSVKQEPLKVCAGCSQKQQVSAYCFKCNDFLCQGCHEYHSTAKILKDHRDHIFSLSEAEARNLTIEKLSSLKEAPRCHNHPQKLSELCCTTCGNLPICMPCTYGAHQGHNLKEVSSLAKIEREKLQVKVADLMQYKEKIYKMQEEIRNTKGKLSRNIHEEKQKLKEQLDVKQEIIKREIRDTDEKLKQRQVELEENLMRKASTRKQELEREMRDAREKYEKLCKEERQEADDEFKKLQQENEREKAELQEGLDTMNNNIKELLTSLKTQEEENTSKIKEMSDHFDDIVKRFETVTTTASSILAAKHDWTDVQCIPDICTTIHPLIVEVKREMPELETLSDVTIRGLSLVTGRRSKVDISEKEESIVDIKGITKGREIIGITSNNDGSIVITGGTSYGQLHITVIKRNGEQLRQEILPSTLPYHNCDILSQFKVALVSQNNEIVIYDIRDGTYRKAKISDLITNWPFGQHVRCVAVDHVNNHIFVGCSRQDVYVFNSQLGYIKTLTLPEKPKWLMDITVHEDNLLICDSDGWRTCAVTMEGSKCKLLYKFPNPDLGGVDWRSYSVCTAKNGFVYMLWGAIISWKNRSMIVQYSDDGKLLSTRLLDEKYYAQCISTVDTEEGEKLVMATFKTGKLITYVLE